MQQRNTTGILILLMTIMLVTAGCGLFAGNEYPGTGSADGSSGSALPANDGTQSFKMANLYYNLSSANPNQGTNLGGEVIALNGTFPTVGGASLIYTVYFGNNIAKYNAGIFNFFTSSKVEVVAPPGDALGSVTVSMFDKSAGMYIIYAPAAYAYVDPFNLISVDPIGGPAAGGNNVTLFGQMPVAAPITSLAVANADYSVTFDGVPATFVPNSLGQYITAGAMYVQAPAHAPGLVDVAATAGPHGTRTLSNAYRYLGDFEILALDPNAGHISGLNTVIVEGSFPVASAIYNLNTASSQYTVYFGTQIANFVQPPDSQAIISAGMMYVEAPPSPIATVVDVDVFSDSDGQQAVVSDPVANDYTYFTLMHISEVYPDNGYLGVNMPVQILAKLPITADVTNINIANAYYNVEFDGVPAFYNSTVNPIIEITNAYGEYNALMNMFTPPGTVVGPVDVALLDANNVEPPSKLVDGYTYNPLMEIIDVYPDSGPTSGGTQVDVLVNVPTVLSILDDVALANSLYSVEFGGVEASFDLTNPPIIQTIAAGQAYNTYFHMVTPPFTPPGFVDVTLIDEDGLADDAIGTDFYEYVSGSSIGQWTSVVIEPNPVGPLQAGELQVTVTVDGNFGNSTMFIVPQGGDPLNTTHRIPLDIVSSGTTTATAVNEFAITTEVYSTGVSNTLYADGHAAVYIQDEFGTIIGDDYVDLTDSGGIGGTAVLERHFIIDTLPPVQYYDTMLTSGLSTDLVDHPVVLGGPYGYGGVGRPFPLPSTDPFGNFPWSDDPITNLDYTPNNTIGAQRFFNILSISNQFDSFPDETFKPRVIVGFKDYDIANHPAYAGIYIENSALNEDKFDPGQYYRAPAGFAQLTAPGLTFNGPAREILLASPPSLDVPARWEIQGGSNASVEETQPQISYYTEEEDTIGGFVYLNGIDITPEDRLYVAWEFPNVDDGFLPGDYADPMRLVLKFAAADRAGLYLPRGDATADPRAIMTPRAHLIDPLQIWWMREVQTQIIADQIPADGITSTPFLEWTLAGAPRPQLDANDPAEPRFYVEIWRSDEASVNPDEFRDGPYTQVYAVSDWVDGTSVDPGSLVTLRDNYWYLVSVMGSDEAHNVEQWPAELLRSGTNISEVQSASLQGRNWRRFYVGGENSDVDTRVTWEFWYDDVPFGTVENGEIQYANRTIVPAPADPNVNLRVIFNGRVLSDLSGNRLIDWRFSGTDILPETLSGANESPPFFPTAFLGDPLRQRAFSYVVSAQGQAGAVADTTPANIRITVIAERDIPTYLSNRQSDDQQPFIEFDRE